MKKILSFLGVFFLSTNLSGSILIDSNELSNTLTLKQNENHNLKQNNLIKSLKFDKLFPPRYACGCVLSTFETIINYFYPNSTISQEQIFSDLNDSTATIGQRGIAIDQRAARYLMWHTSRPYELWRIEPNSGNLRTKRIWFRDYIIHNLTQGIPIVASVFLPDTQRRHSFIIRGIHQDVTSGMTTFEIIDNGLLRSIDEDWFWDYYRENEYNEHRMVRIIGLRPEKEYKKNKISLKAKVVDFFGNLFSQKSREARLDVNLSDAGIYSLSYLQTFKKLNIDSFQMKYDWFDKEEKRNQESWQTKYMNFEKHDWEKDNDKSWNFIYHNFARSEFETYYRSNLYQEDNGDLILSLQYKFQALTQLTTTWPLLTVLLGSIITLSLD